MADRTAWQRIQDEKGVVLEAIRHVAALRRFGRLPAGDGQPVMVLPAFSVSDRGTWPLRRVLGRLGYDVHGWGLGKNEGMTHESVAALKDRFDALVAELGRPVSLVGWSLGGVFGREVARRRAGQVTSVITLGSPFRSIEERQGWEPPPVPTVAVYSKTDALVPWRNASEPEGPLRESVEVAGTHSGLALNPAVIEIVADRLPRLAARRPA
ncbi:MAG: alpha/beta hydrolase [Actinomycetota bacterium]